MKDTIVYFYPSNKTTLEVEKIFNEEKKSLRLLLSSSATINIQHVGSSSVPGALSKPDIDIQIRVQKNEFNEVLNQMKSYFTPKHIHLWTEEFSIFKSKQYQEIPVDYMVTVIDSEFDDFYKVRDFLKLNPDILHQYNELKMKYHGKMYSEYRVAKSEFFGGNGRVRFLKN